MERPQPNSFEARKQLFRMSFDGEVKHTETDEVLNVFGERYETVEELDLSGVYEHYKSTPDAPKLYYVIDVRRDIETGECLVIYFPLYETDEVEVCARPLSMFTGSVEVIGEEAPRFRYLGSDLEDV
jgi:hypothetical protein